MNKLIAYLFVLVVGLAIINQCMAFNGNLEQAVPIGIQNGNHDQRETIGHQGQPNHLGQYNNKVNKHEPIQCTDQTQCANQHRNNTMKIFICYQGKCYSRLNKNRRLRYNRYRLANNQTTQTIDPIGYHIHHGDPSHPSHPAYYDKQNDKQEPIQCIDSRQCLNPILQGLNNVYICQDHKCYQEINKFLRERNNIYRLGRNQTLQTFQASSQVSSQDNMVKAWYINDDHLVTNETVQRSERHLNSPKYVTIDDLKSKIGVKYEWVDVDKYNTDDSLQEIARQKHYHYSDILDIHPQRLENYSEKLAKFYTEHMHPNDEVRLVLKGSAYFDVRDMDNQWIRIHVEKGDLLSFVGGSYHRFTLDHNGYIKLFRLFGSKPYWSSFDRPADLHPARIAYVKKAIKGF